MNVLNDCGGSPGEDEEVNVFPRTLATSLGCLPLSLRRACAVTSQRSETRLYKTSVGKEVNRIGIRGSSSVGDAIIRR